VSALTSDHRARCEFPHGDVHECDAHGTSDSGTIVPGPSYRADALAIWRPRTGLGETTPSPWQSARKPCRRPDGGIGRSSRQTRPQTTSFGCSEATRSALSGPDCAAWEIPSTRSSRRKGKSCAARKVCGRVDTTSRSTYPTDSSPMIDAMTMPTMTRRIRPAHCSFQEQSAQPEPAPRSAAPSRPTLVWRDVQIVAGLLLSLFCGTLASDLLIQFWAR